MTKKVALVLVLGRIPMLGREASLVRGYLNGQGWTPKLKRVLRADMDATNKNEKPMLVLVKAGGEMARGCPLDGTPICYVGSDAKIHRIMSWHPPAEVFKVPEAPQEPTTTEVARAILREAERRENALDGRARR